MPPHDTYIELFAGSGAIILNKPPAALSYAVDLNAECLAKIRKHSHGQLGEIRTVCRDAISFIDGFNYARSHRTLIYADPPYLHSTRTSRHRYRFELTDADHVRLLTALRRTRADIVVSGYPSALYDDELTGWNTREFQAMTRGGPRTEKLWFNFEPSAVAWATWAGRGFTDRQRIKRKAARWAANFRDLPAGERLAVLSALMLVNAGSHSRQ
jgi:DNA adenine methylase